MSDSPEPKEIVVIDLTAPKLRRPPRLPRATRQIGDIHVCGQDCLHLSRRDVELIGMVAEGLTNKQIAMRLGRADRTIHNRVYHLEHRMGVNSRSEMIALAFRSGIVK